MTRFIHKLSLSFYFITVLVAFGLLTYIGFSYYRLPIEERFFHAQYELLKPSGLIGHGLGIIGSLIMLFGLFSYMVRKRLKMFSRLGTLKYWLEFHIFLCTLGPVMILFHTSFKFGGIVSVGFWSMAIVWSSGVIGRFLYLQIPRTIEGRELSLRENEEVKDQLNEELKTKYDIDFSQIKTGRVSTLKLKLISKDIAGKDLRKIKKLVRNQRILTRRIEHLDKMKNLFKYWHFAHLPFALILIVIMLIHVVVVLTFGYKWIF
jgi:hypothetical protein